MSQTRDNEWMQSSAGMPAAAVRVDGQTWRFAAPAKINLNLLAGPRRADGFHDLDSYVAKVTLIDSLDIVVRTDEQVTFRCDGADCGSDEKNLSLRAARLLQQEAAQRGMAAGAQIALTKRVPPGKGLGGGSSDAATTLAALNMLWKVGLDLPALSALGAQLGSDVPLFLHAAASRMTGRGEILEPLQVAPFHAILFLSDCVCATGEVYRAFDAIGPTMPTADATAPPAALAARQLPAQRLLSPPSQWRDALVNDLNAAALQVCPELGTLWRELQAALPVPVHMTGSGSALFCLLDNRRELDGALAGVPQQLRPMCHVVDSM